MVNIDDRLLKEGMLDLGLTPTDEICRKFGIYLNELEEKNKVMNLTAISGDEEVTKLHFLDSLSLLRYADFAGKTAIDIGSGAGFPGLPVKICCPELSLMMLDAQTKRINFLNGVCEAASIEGAKAVHGRAEEFAVKNEFRDSFDFALSRAVARLNVLCELCLPFVKVGGCFLAMKSTDTEDEINEAKTAIKTLGGRIDMVEDYDIYGTDVTHRVVIIKKEKATPKGYPRRYAKITKSPL